MSLVTRKIIFVGRVQGVGFRFTAYAIANRIGLKGQVRNMSDGSVEMIAQGKPENINQCLRDLKETYQQDIRQAKVEEAISDREYADFKITF